MNSHYASQGRQPRFPYKADPEFNPDADFGFDDHGQPLEPNAQQALNVQTGAPTLMLIGNTEADVQQPPQMTQQTVQAWNEMQTQSQPNVQMQPTPMISASSAPMQSMSMPSMPPRVQTQQLQFQPQPSQPILNFGQQQAQTMQELRQPAPTVQSACAAASVPTVQNAVAYASANPYNFEAMWNQLLPGKYGVLIP
eukprot:671896-Amphidinium_carterae.1